MEVKLVALDLDGTTLKSSNELSPRTRMAFKKAIEKGVHIVIATGRSYHSLPTCLKDVEGLEYAITSNGAIIRELESGKVIHKNCIDPKSIDQVYSLLKKDYFMTEVFTDGRAYIGRDDYDKILSGLESGRSMEYVRDTRKPVDDILEFMIDHREDIENINTFFFNDDEEVRLNNLLSQIDNVTLTSSTHNNCEIGSMTTSKASGLKVLSEKLGVKYEEIMAAGDSPNDIEMLKLAGTKVAVLNARPEVKEVANYITASNEDDGVAKAIEKYVLK